MRNLLLYVGVRTGVIGIVIVGLLMSAARAQIPGLSPPPKPPVAAAPADTTGLPVAAPTKDNPNATVAASPGPITVEEPVPDRALRATLEGLLPKYPGVHAVQVAVDRGVVTLGGQVRDDATHNEVTGFVRRVEGVRLVLNRMMTDDQVMTAGQLAARELCNVRAFLARKWLLMLLALGIVAASIALARLVGAYSETLLAPLVRGVLLRSMAGSLLSTLLIIGGVLMALSLLELTQVVLSILGMAGVVGLAVGFAFRDIAENFIASVLLGVRRPFQVGDHVQVAGHSGMVKTLNTRATVLVTLEGDHVRIPNAVVYKEILVNSSASPSSRGSFDVLIPNEVSTSAALEAMNRALGEQDGVLTEPAPRALVEALEPAGVRLRAYFWMPAHGVDGPKLMSDARLKVKVALQQVGIAPPQTNTVALMVAGRVPGDDAEPGDAVAVHPSSPVTARQARANLRRDSHAAASAPAVSGNGRKTPAMHALKQAETRVSEEGANLLKDQRSE
jgi:small conductance mechanosensitive channel